MKKQPKSWIPKEGDIVEIRFWDHAEDTHEPYLFHVFGRLAKVAARSVVVESWAYTKGEVGEPGDTNVKSFVLVASAIEEIIKLVPAKS